MRIVLTGGPGSGKTTLLAALARAGYATLPEAGRAVILQQQACGGDALPWRDRARFASAMLEHAVSAFHSTEETPGPVFFDRGIGDVLGYLELVGLGALSDQPVEADRSEFAQNNESDVASRCQQAAQACRYHAQVFIAPFWPEIYVNDAERKQDLTEAEATCAVMARIWPALGYELVWLPKAPVAERVKFMLAQIA